MLVLASCNKDKQNVYDGLSKEYFEKVSLPGLTINSHSIREEISRLSGKGNGNSLNTPHAYVRTYYNIGGDFLWIDRNGVSPKADTLLCYLDTLDADGFRKERMHIDELRERIEVVRELAVGDDEEGRLNEHLAYIEYHLTRNFLKYAVGMHYGITNPSSIFNSLDIRDSDSVRVTYRQLFDVDVHVAGKKTFEQSLLAVKRDSLGTFLRESIPTSPLYARLKRELRTASGEERNIILINMERARWRTAESPYSSKEYVIVNIPAYHLWGVSENEQIDMKVGCGANKTKTPLLHSHIQRMEINPQWIIPGSITTKDIIHHAGDADYFNRHNYYAVNRTTGKKLYGADITSEVILSKNYYIAQKGGHGNSLGRIIFRFPNNFAVYLHDTSSRGFFARDNRSVSHGCIRVDRPYDLACFLLRGKNEDIAEKIRYSMEADLDADNIDKSKLIYNTKVEPEMPIFITYYTRFLTPQGNLEKYPDVYGYDKAMLEHLDL